MIVGVNATALTAPEVRGWTRYAVNLLRELRTLGVGLRLYSRGPLYPAHLTALGAGDCSVTVAPPMRYALWEQGWLPRQCRRDGVALLHSLHNFGLPLRCPVPRVLTLHDAIDSVYYQDRLPLRDWLRPGNARGRLMHQVARRSADRVVTVSEHAKADLVRRFGLPAGRVTVIPEAADSRFHTPPTAAESARVAATYRLTRPYFFYVGGAEGRKNVGFLVTAFARAGLPGVELVLAGSGHGVPAAGVRAIGYVPDADLPALYAGALGFVYPSHYEGFGLQLVEAMAAGCPTLAADATCLPEVLGRGGDTFPLGDPAPLTELLRRLYGDPAYRADLAARGRTRAGDFSWARAARATLAVYDEVLRT